MKRKCLFNIIFVLILLIGLHSSNVSALTMQEIYENAIASDSAKIYEPSDNIQLPKYSYSGIVAYLDDDFNIAYSYTFWFNGTLSDEYANKLVLNPGMNLEEFIGVNAPIARTAASSTKGSIPNNQGNTLEFTGENAKYSAGDLKNYSYWRLISLEDITKEEYSKLNCLSSGKDTTLCQLLMPVYERSYLATLFSRPWYNQPEYAMVTLNDIYVFMPYEIPAEPEEEETTTTTTTSTTTTAKEEEKIENPKTGSKALTVIVLVSIALVAAVVIFLLTRKNTKFNLID